jgi:hypothetical protein
MAIIGLEYLTAMDPLLYECFEKLIFAGAMYLSPIFALTLY